MKVEHESVGRKLIYKGDILNADDTKSLNKAMFNHHKNESKGFFQKKKKKELLYLIRKTTPVKAQSTKVLHTDLVILCPRQTVDCIERDGWKIPPNMSKQSRVLSKQVAFQIVLCLCKLRRELVFELNSFGDQESS